MTRARKILSFLGLSFLVLSVLLVTGLTIALASPHANATALKAHPSPTARTCAAYRAWTAHRTTANLDRMVVASLAAPWRNLGNDVDVVYADVRDGNRTDLPGDVAGIRADCKGR